MSEPRRRETEVTADCFGFDHVTLLYGLARVLMPTAFLSGLLQYKLANRNNSWECSALKTTIIPYYNNPFGK